MTGSLGFFALAVRLVATGGPPTSDWWILKLRQEIKGGASEYVEDRKLGTLAVSTLLIADALTLIDDERLDLRQRHSPEPSGKASVPFDRRSLDVSTTHESRFQSFTCLLSELQRRDRLGWWSR
jgi:hypothetical protein